MRYGNISLDNPILILSYDPVGQRIPVFLRAFKADNDILTAITIRRLQDQLILMGCDKFPEPDLPLLIIGLSHPIVPHNLADQPSNQKRLQRLTQLKEDLAKQGLTLSSLRCQAQRASQLCVKYYRWLRHALYEPTCWQRSVDKLQLLYDKL